MFKGDRDDEDGESKMMFKPSRRAREGDDVDVAESKDSDTGGGRRGGRRNRDEEDEKSSVGNGGDAKGGDDTGGWMASPGNRRTQRAREIEEEERDEKEKDDLNNTSKKNANRHFADDQQDDDGIIMIPDLDDDDAYVEKDTRVAQAPRVVTQIPTLEELDKKLKASGTYIESEYDLSALTQVLHPPEDLIEADEVWDFDSLLREVTQELHSISKTVVNATVSTPASESGGGPGKKGKKGGKKK